MWSSRQHAGPQQGGGGGAGFDSHRCWLDNHFLYHSYPPRFSNQSLAKATKRVADNHHHHFPEITKNVGDV